MSGQKNDLATQLFTKVADVTAENRGLVAEIARMKREARGALNRSDVGGAVVWREALERILTPTN